MLQSLKVDTFLVNCTRRIGAHLGERTRFCSTLQFLIQNQAKTLHHLTLTNISAVYELVDILTPCPGLRSLEVTLMPAAELDDWIDITPYLVALSATELDLYPCLVPNLRSLTIGISPSAVYCESSLCIRSMEPLVELRQSRLIDASRDAPTLTTFEGPSASLTRVLILGATGPERQELDTVERLMKLAKSRNIPDFRLWFEEVQPCLPFGVKL
ncbi:hypothetical protein FA15DRAFT_710364 [Coprinopsis marcescibilis]|uniref:F-box domain-containing protein n=1 Tax=Coprinopsis marcescibilis TaxID=230819 RepID=A0A5C3KDS8_COPMA|nr:hypothetical protein FA15DRAFT_710364 [Coprinopsis marcescibilis]